MAGAADFRALAPRELRLELEALYADYTGCLDEERFEEWPNFFVEDCLYKIVPRENYERGLPLATWLCESKGYLLDRITGIRKTSMYAPRTKLQATRTPRAAGSRPRWPSRAQD